MTLSYGRGLTVEDCWAVYNHICSSRFRESTTSNGMASGGLPSLPTVSARARDFDYFTLPFFLPSFLFLLIFEASSLSSLIGVCSTGLGKNSGRREFLASSMSHFQLCTDKTGRSKQPFVTGLTSADMTLVIIRTNHTRQL